MTHPSLGPGDHAPDVINAIVEIPTGSRVKYEFDHATGMIFVDRVLFSPFHYPAEYGFIPKTLAPDGDPCDVLVLINGTTYPGVIIRARPVGLLKMHDEHGQDDKVLCVADKDPNYAHVETLGDLPPHFMKEVEHFFLTYKDLEQKDVHSDGWAGKDEAKAFVMQCIHAYPG
ncbi:MAG: inorganic diphosphatase [Acidobacteriota bacterium]|nr:inorganic diphosphatase [Acidobacteriota bacterium]